MNQLKRIWTFLIKLLFRNHRTLNGGKVLKNQVTLEYWQGCVNIGDQLAPVIFNWMLERNGLENQRRGSCHLLTVGSIIGEEKYDATVWGSGVLSLGAAKSIFRLGRLIHYDIRAVRGPVTREVMLLAGHDVPAVYGDPGILMPLIFTPPSEELPSSEHYAVSLIRHYKADSSEPAPPIHQISVQTSDYRAFITEICRSEKIISSSLHGIILAEAYGVPAVFLNENNEEFLKYMDWYYATGRTEIKVAHTVQEAVQMTPMPLPDLTEMQKQLMEAFPSDLFKPQKAAVVS